jgi:solute carrier family 25 oxoglutarate transporter 11
MYTEDSSKGGNIVTMAYNIYSKEGIFAFWTGFGAYFGRTAPHAMIILLSTEPIVAGYRKLFL